MFLCALVGPLFPPPPAPCPLFVPFLCVRLSCCCFLFFWFRARVPCCSRTPCVCPLLFSVLPWSRCPAPPLSPVSPPILLLAVVPVCTSALPVCAALSLVCATLVLYPCPSPSPYPFPWVLHRSPPLTPSWLPGAPCGGGGVYLWSGLWPCTHHAPETLVEFLPLHLHCGAQPLSQGSHSFALRRCPTAPVATKAWRGQPL